MRFKTFLTEESIGDAQARWTPKKLTDEQIIEWCEDNASRFLANGTPVYRGTFGNLSGLLNTDNLNRKSANTFNTYNLWIDNHVSWAEFPKRSKSIICSYDDDTASAFGENYLIIPEDTALVGICPTSDIWGSFEDLINILGQGGRSADTFLDILNAIGVQSDTWKNLKSSSSKIEINEIKGSGYMLKGALDFKIWCSENEYLTVFDALEDIFDPHTNNFKSGKASELSVGGDHEIWLSGSILQIQIEQMSEKVIKYFKRYFGYFEKTK